MARRLADWLVAPRTKVLAKDNEGMTGCKGAICVSSLKVSRGQHNYRFEDFKQVAVHSPLVQ